ncbi:hypothetical protein TNCV_128391 [Trichonephila clavipes]|nr:hypothetical protein TNCV_128391 [Trichonephila clavipes]
MSNCIANEKNIQRHMLRTQQSNMQPDLKMHVCEHIICFLQHQVCSVLDKRNTIGYEWLKDINEKQHFTVKHDLVASNHTITVPLHSSATQQKIIG